MCYSELSWTNLAEFKFPIISPSGVNVMQLFTVASLFGFFVAASLFLILHFTKLDLKTLFHTNIQQIITDTDTFFCKC